MYNGDLKYVAIMTGKEVYMGKNIHVVYNGKQWQAIQENAKRSSGNFSTQKEAFNLARKIAINNGQEVVIHRPDGTIRDKYSYGNDPFPPKG